MKKVSIYSLIIVPETVQYLVTLEEEKGTRLIPIWIGPSEGMAISAALRKEFFPRPLTHDLMWDILKAMGAVVEKVVVRDLENGTFLADMYVKHSESLHKIDARPSDAIAIALRSLSPIFVDGKVFDKCPVIEKPITADEIESFRHRFETLRPEDFFKEKKDNG
jgi:uncharacterized protein